MTAKGALLSLPNAQLAPLVTSYEKTVAKRRLAVYGILAVLFVLSLLASYAGEVSGTKLYNNFGNFTSYFQRIIPTLHWDTLWTDFREWFWNAGRWINLILDTLLIAYVGNVLGVLGGFVLCFFSTNNLMPNPVIRFIARRFLEFCRTVPTLVFALVMILAFGLGPMAGVIAIAIHTIGALGKLFAEVVENIDMKPVDGVRACGGSWMETVRYAALPQVLPSFASYSLLRYEINVREASVMGFVGAGGIGQDFLEAIRKFYYSDVSAILLLIMITVFTIDILTSKLRHRLIGLERR
jgi:phosphonate transport system permease protein